MSVRRKTVLVIDANDEARERLSQTLRRDYRVVRATSAESGLALMEREEVDVLVTDVSLPGMSGVDLARRVLLTNPYYWVVLCTGYEFNHRLTDLGINVRALVKPFDVKQLEALMNEIAAAAMKTS